MAELKYQNQLASWSCMHHPCSYTELYTYLGVRVTITNCSASSCSQSTMAIVGCMRHKIPNGHSISLLCSKPSRVYYFLFFLNQLNTVTTYMYVARLHLHIHACISLRAPSRRFDRLILREYTNTAIQDARQRVISINRAITVQYYNTENCV